jgi:hypothetical protein
MIINDWYVGLFVILSFIYILNKIKITITIKIKTYSMKYILDFIIRSF